MKLNNLGNNKSEVITNDGKVVFFSYNTPVAACVEGRYYRTSQKWSVTTSKHIGSWLEGVKAEEKPQEWFDSLV